MAQNSFISIHEEQKGEVTQKETKSTTESHVGEMQGNDSGGNPMNNGTSADGDFSSNKCEEEKGGAHLQINISSGEISARSLLWPLLWPYCCDSDDTSRNLMQNKMR